MPRMRTLKPGFFTNDLLAEIAPLGRLLFQGLWCIADREGRLEDRPRRIKAEVLPYDDADVNQLLDDLAERGFIQRYAANGNTYIQIVTFAKHQSPHVKEAPSTIPAPGQHSASTGQGTASAPPVVGSGKWGVESSSGELDPEELSPHPKLVAKEGGIRSRSSGDGDAISPADLDAIVTEVARITRLDPKSLPTMLTRFAANGDAWLLDEASNAVEWLASAKNKRHQAMTVRFLRDWYKREVEGFTTRHEGQHDYEHQRSAQPQPQRPGRNPQSTSQYPKLESGPTEAEQQYWLERNKWALQRRRDPDADTGTGGAQAS